MTFNIIKTLRFCYPTIFNSKNKKIIDEERFIDNNNEWNFKEIELKVEDLKEELKSN